MLIPTPIANSSAGTRTTRLLSVIFYLPGACGDGASPSPDWCRGRPRVRFLMGRLPEQSHGAQSSVKRGPYSPLGLLGDRNKLSVNVRVRLSPVCAASALA